MQKPVCECGGELIYYEGRGLEIGYKITKEGKRYCKCFCKDEGGSEYQGLHCEKCDTNYDVEQTEDGFLIKGEKKDDGFVGKYW